MSMQLSCLPQQNPSSTQSVNLPPSDIQLMRNELTTIDKLMQDITDGKADETTFEGLKAAILALNEIILSLDNSNDFFKIGGFNVLMPLLSCPNSDVVAVCLELVADLCQNNKYCQTKMLDLNILPELVKLLDNSDVKVCSKSLYAVSCLCRHNDDAIKHLEITSIIPLLIKILEVSDERFRTKAAFFLSYLSTFENFRETLYQADIIKVLAKLLKAQQDSSSEHLLSALFAQVSKHKQSRIQCRQMEHGLKDILLEKIKLYESKSEYQEAEEYCSKILDTCFHE